MYETLGSRKERRMEREGGEEGKEVRVVGESGEERRRKEERKGKEKGRKEGKRKLWDWLILFNMMIHSSIHFSSK
jgi:hypothetical protein